MTLANDDSFYALKEIYRLEVALFEHKKMIIEENHRVEKILKEKLKRAKHLENLQKELIELNQQSKDLEKKLDKNLHRHQTFSSGSDQIKKTNIFQQTEVELQKILEEKNLIEEQMFVILEKIEANTSEQATIKNFFLGIDETIQEINADSKSKINQFEKKISEFKSRLEEILEHFPPKLNQMYIRFRELYPDRTLVSSTKGDLCGECHLTLNRSLLSNVDRRIDFYQCPHCLRILLPDKL